MFIYFETALRAVLARRSSNVVLLDYRKAFSELWLKSLDGDGLNIDGRRISWNEPGPTIVIVGIAPPERSPGEDPDCVKTIDFESHLTSLSWAAEWRRRHRNSPVKICIVGFQGNGISGPSAPVLAKMFGHRDSNGKYSIPGVAYFEKPALAALLSWVDEETNSVKMSDTSASLLHAAVSGGLAESPDSYHSISNVVGAYAFAQITASDKPEPGQGGVRRSQLVEAFQRLLIAAGLGEKSPAPWFDLMRNSDVITRVELFDDMADIWKPFLGAALGIKPAQIETRIRQDGQLDYDSFLRIITDGEGKPVVRRETNAGDLPTKSLLFLDLRLFGGRLENEELAFLQKLLALAKQLSSSKAVARNFPWPGFSKKEIDQISLSLATNSRDSEGFHRALALLPRLLAIAEPTLPIVIFSSTRQRAILEALQPYANVITHFHKPYISRVGNFSGLVDEIRSSFVRAMHGSLRVAHSRRIHTDLRRVFGSGSRAMKTEKQIQSPRKPCLIELFIDESEKRKEGIICVGGLTLVRPIDQNGDPIPSDKDIWQRLSNESCLWGHCDVGPSIPKKKMTSLEKGLDLDFAHHGDGFVRVNKILALLAIALGPEASVSPFAVIQARSGTYSWLHASVPQDSAERVFDITVRKLGLICLQAVMSCGEDVVQALKHPASRIAIDFPTRQVTAKTERELMNAFGVTQNHQDSSAVWGFLNEFTRRISGENCMKGRIVRARAVQLQDFGTFWHKKGGVLPPKQLHYLADWIAHIALHHPDIISKSHPDILRFFQRGFIGHLSEEQFYSSILDAQQASREGRLVDAVLGAWESTKSPSRRWVPEVPSLTDFVANGADTWFERLRCEDLNGVFNRAQKASLASATTAAPP